MPTSNETIIAVPVSLETHGQTRQFLVRLVEQLDIIIGGRGGDPYVSNSQLQATTLEGLTKLEQTILDIITRLLSANTELTEELITTITQEATGAIDDLKSSDTVDNASTSNPVVSDPPTQAEVQAISDRVASNASKFNDLLIALRGTGIIAT